MNNEDITVKPFTPKEWETYKLIRIKALSADPHVFGASLTDTLGHPDSKWQDDLNNEDLGIFGVFEKDNIIGMTGIIIKHDNQNFEYATLWGSWLEKSYRGKGVSEKMYAARLAWAKTHLTLQKIIVSHRESNMASKNANQKHGFVFTHKQDHLWHDGVTEPEVFYELVLT